MGKPSTKNIQDRATRTHHITGGEPRASGMASNLISLWSGYWRI